MYLLRIILNNNLHFIYQLNSIKLRFKTKKSWGAGNKKSPNMPGLILLKRRTITFWNHPPLDEKHELQLQQQHQRFEHLKALIQVR